MCQIKKMPLDIPSVILVSLDEIKNTENMSDIESYAYEFTRWEEAVTFLVADNKLTQDNLMDVVVDFLYEVSFNGYTEEAVDKAIAELNESTAELENSGIEADEVFMHELIEAVHIEEYPDEDALKDDINKAVSKYNSYCRNIELEILKKNL